MTSDSSSRRSRWLIASWRFAAAAIWLKVVIDLTIRDRIPWVAMVYYAVPPVLLAIAAAATAWIGKRLRRSYTAVLALWCLAVRSAVYWLYSDIRFVREPDRLPSTLRVAFWNVGRGWFADWSQITERMSEFDADLLLLTEATAPEVETPEYWRTHLPGYFPLPLASGLVLLVRGQATLLASDSLVASGEYRRVDVVIRGVPFQLILVDIVSDPWLPRRPPLDALWEIMKTPTDRPVLVIGDFNTPPTSVCFDRWRGEWTRAWDAAGGGYQPTWPQPLPVLTLDQIWGNRWIRFCRCTGSWSRCSDHRPVMAEFTVRPGSDVQNSELVK